MLFTGLRDLIARLLGLNVDAVLAGFERKAKKLEKIGARELQRAGFKREFANTLHNEADDHENEAVRADRGAIKLRDFTV